MVHEQNLESAFEAEVAPVTLRPELWEQVRAETEPRLRRRRLWKEMTTIKRVSAVIAGCLVLGSLLVGGQTVVARFFPRPGDPQPLYMVKAKAPGDHGPDEIIGTKPSVDNLSLAEAKSRAKFSVVAPAYLPAGSSIAAVQLLTEYGGQRVVIHYQMATGAFTVQQWNTDPTHQPYVKGDNATPVHVSGVDGWLTTAVADGHTSCSLIWSRDGVSFALHSMDLARDQVLKIAESIR